jgi:hypothetical protein
MGRDANDEGLPLERLDLETMASGNQSLRLTERVSWEGFPSYAEVLVHSLGGAIVHRADSAAERVWTATVRGGTFWVSFDHFGLGVSLDPQNAEAARLIPGIQETLLAVRNAQRTG